MSNTASTTTERHTIRVAPEPSDGALTYAEVIADATRVSDLSPFVDDETPEGHFGAVVGNLGGVQTYWFRGEPGEGGARIVARTQFVRDECLHYVGGSLFGGLLSPMRVPR